MPGARLVKCLIVLAIILSLLISSWSRKWLRAAPYNSDLFQGMETYTSNQSRHHEKEQLKKVLFWNEPYPGRKKANQASGVNGEFSVSEYVQLLEGCASEYQCEITSNGRTSDPDVLKRYHAIVFHQRSWNFVDIPKHRWPHQRYVFLSMESPAWKFIDSESMAGFFNWTMTYRRDSDIHNPYMVGSAHYKYYETLLAFKVRNYLASASSKRNEWLLGLCRIAIHSAAEMSSSKN